MHQQLVEKIIKRRLSIITALALSLVVVFTGACSKAASPTETLKAYYEAASKKDIPTVKKYLSQGTMKFMEEGAKKMGKSVDEMFKEGAAASPPTVTPTFSNEKINGDNATVDISAPGQPTVTMPLVKEGGEWKIAIDKLIETMKASMGAPTAPTTAPTMPPLNNSNTSKTADDDDEDHDNANH